MQRRFKSKHRDWLQAGDHVDPLAAHCWPLTITLGVPTENQALKQVNDVRIWVAAWQSWHGPGSLSWSNRRWRKLGTQRVPEKLSVNSPAEVAQWIGEADRWDCAQRRYQAFIERWPRLANTLARHFNVLADYREVDYRRLVNTIAYIEQRPAANLYPRQLPVSGLDSKWLEKRQGLLADLVGAVRGESSNDSDFYQRCGLKKPPQLIRLRILDSSLRKRLGGLEDLSAPWQQLAKLDLPADTVFIVENLHTGLAFEDLPGSVVIMQLGYGVDVLSHLPWVVRSPCIYWGDLDTHGFAILNRARSHLPTLTSLLMDEATLHNHQALWVTEKEPHPAATLPLLTPAEQTVYQAIKRNVWGQHIRLEQERIGWDIAWKTVRQAIGL